ncbi:T9SS type B sorting domain-containing protein [Maribacter sp. M208]|uniref:T9SS type B sorting domain-containing protein n=1 Tax=Maribacter huludaoensis TaxID=3030010 RepID=UPI0023EB6D5E|nr:T9SS type B sorting domain-containing protein [Maribacter huludaoensis]MDF4222874.1 T9SS type B sorting domain-containing protein [Maribacter huludaoensis]
MLHRTLYLAILFFSFSFIAVAQDADFDGVLDGVDFCPNTADPSNADSDGDGVGDVCDLDDDNDGILDFYDCEIPIPNYSFESPTYYSFPDGWDYSPTLYTLGQGIAGTHNIEPTTNYPIAPEQNQFLYINSDGTDPVVSITLSNHIGIFAPGSYILTLNIGDGLSSTNRYRNDGISTIELGYGNDPASFTPINSLIEDGTNTLDGTFNEFSFTTVLNLGDPAIGQGILIRITHEAQPNAVAGNYDNIRLVRDTDGDGISDCLEIDADNDGCFDAIEAGHLANASGELNNSGLNADGTVIPLGTGYSGNTQEVIDDSLNSCDPTYNDNDSDGVLNNLDLDDDNDGIRDEYECEIPIENHSFEADLPGSSPQTGWIFNSTSGAGIEEIISPPNVDPNFFTAPDGNQLAFINGTGTILLSEVYASYEISNYILSVYIGDGINESNPFRNDGQSIIELGYLDGIGNFQTIPGGNRIVEGYETPPGIWMNFDLNVNIPLGSPALGNGIVVRITHTENGILNQRAGNYDNIRIVKDADNDGISNCFDTDSDNDGCPDVEEAGHANGGTDTLAGGAVDADGLITGYATGYSGPTNAVFNNLLDTCNPIDTDNDGLANDDGYTQNLPANNDDFDLLDKDNDNDGITDIEEGCNLTTVGLMREAYAFEVPLNNFIYDPGAGNDTPSNQGNPLMGTRSPDFWLPSDFSVVGTSLVRVQDYIDPATTLPYSPNYYADGSGISDDPTAASGDATRYDNDSFVFINGTASITQDRFAYDLSNRVPTIIEGGYIVTVSVGDGLDIEDRFRNDGTSLLEAGYDDGSGFTVLSSRTVTPDETPNGTWTDISYNVPIPAGSPAIGELLLLRITHTINVANNQEAGNYDNIRINFDYDNDGIPDCNDSDSDNDGCPDATEAGFTNDDNDDFVGNGVPAIDGDGLVLGTDGYTTPVSPNVRSYSEPAVIDTGLTNPNEACEGSDAVFTVIATRDGTNTTIIYEWYESTDGGTTFTLLVEDATYIGTTTTELTIAGVTTGLDGNLYRVRVMGDDNLCYEESIATLNVTAGPTPITPVATTASICEGEDAEFTITGTPGDIITYSLDGGTTSVSVTLDATGIATITETTTTADVTMEISSIESGTCTLNLVPVTSATVTVNTIPTLDPATTATCSADLATYDVAVVVNAGNITNTSEGVLTGNTITGITAGNDITITVDNNGCIRDLNITAPDCSCPVIDIPVNANNQSICFGTATPDLSVDLGTNGDAINWYDASTAGTLLNTGTTYTTGETAVGTYTYYAEAIETVSGCTSNRIPVTLTINSMPVADTSTDINQCVPYTLPVLSADNFYYTGPNGSGTNLLEGSDITSTQTIYIYSESGTTPNCFDESSFEVTINETPVLNLLSATCSADLNTYSVTFSNSIPTAILTSNAGTVSGNSVINIPSNTPFVTITANNNGCSPTLTVQAPDCSCPIIDDATNPINVNTCEGSPSAELQVSLGTNGDTINWYTTATGGTSIANGLSFTPTDTAIGTYTYYAEASEAVNGCISSNRIPVTLTIEPIPVADTLNDVEGCEFFVLPNLSNNNNYYTGANGTGQLLTVGSQVSQDQTIYIFAQSPNNQDCSSESQFEVTILEEPIIDLPYEVSICSNTNGIAASVPIGVDLGPNYIYDWTPNNDTNGDGIEEAIFNVSQAGEYSLRIFTIGNTINCGGSLEYIVNVTEAPLPQDIEIEITSEGFELNSGNRVRAIINNDIFAYTNFEYSLDDPDGPYQTDNFFQNVVGGLHTIFVRSIGNCGATLESDPFLIVNYPTYFSPNGDGSNDTWFPLGLADPNLTTNVVAEIYDRHGKLVHYLDPFGTGWDGTYNGESLPESDYWFVIEYIDAIDNNRSIQFKGHFSLIR